MGSIDGLLIHVTITLIPTGLEKLLETTDASVLSKLNIMNQPMNLVKNSTFETVQLCMSQFHCNNIIQVYSSQSRKLGIEILRQ